MCATSAHSRSSAAAGSSRGCTSNAHACVGPGTIDQLVVASLTTVIDSATRGIMSSPINRGSTSSSAWGADGPDSEIRAARSSPNSSTRSPIHGGT